MKRLRPITSATSPWSGTAGRARPAWRRRCCTGPAPSPASDGSRTAPRCATTTPRQQAGHLLSLSVAPFEWRAQGQPDRHAGLRRLHGRRRGRPAHRRPGRVRGQRGRRRGGPDRGGLGLASAGRAPHGLRQQAGPGAGQPRRHLAQRPARRRHRPARRCPSARRRRSGASPTCSPTPPTSTRAAHPAPSRSPTTWRRSSTRSTTTWSTSWWPTTSMLGATSRAALTLDELSTPPRRHRRPPCSPWWWVRPPAR